jgi:hypothetical protein
MKNKKVINRDIPLHICHRDLITFVPNSGYGLSHLFYFLTCQQKNIGFIL